LDFSQVNAAGKPVTWLRVDYTRTPNTRMDIQYMGFFYTATGAENYDAQFDGTAFESKPAAEPEKPNYDGMDRLTVNKTEFTLGEPILVTALGDSNDWIGVFTQDNAITGSKRYYYLSGEANHATSGLPFDVTSGTGNQPGGHTWTVGTYYIGLVEVDESGNRTSVKSIKITVKAAEETPDDTPVEDEFEGIDRLTVNKTEFTLGEPIMITAYGSGTDWVGIFTEKNATGGSKQWWRLQDVDSYVHTPSGEPFDATSTKGNTAFAFTAGTWYISLVDVDKSGNRTLVECIEITVSEPAAE